MLSCFEFVVCMGVGVFGGGTMPSQIECLEKRQV